MKKFMFLHYGFQTPTQEIMQAWSEWFTLVRPHVVDMGGHFQRGRELSQEGERDLPRDLDAITGYTILSAPSFAEAEALAAKNPFISSIRIYEISGGA